MEVFNVFSLFHLVGGRRHALSGAAWGRRAAPRGAPLRPPIDRHPRAPDHAEAKASGKKADIQLSQPTRVAGTVLEPGYYRVQMQREGDRHVLVLARQHTAQSGRAVYSTGGGHEVLRVPCSG